MEAQTPPAGASRADDAILIYRLWKVTKGLPFPSVARDQAAFNFTQIVHAEDTQKAVAWAETILSAELGLTFEPRPVHAVTASAERYILSAWMPSGLRVDIVAKAQHMSAPRPVGAAA